MNSRPLVSVYVITYNSASYIKETLDSVKRQTYKNLELIISDDCSTDDTVEICRAWLDENRTCFVRAELVSTPHNMGVAGNCNNAIRATTGEWLKGLSGDDKFLDYTIEEYVNYVNEHPECRICFAKLHFWGDDEDFVRQAKRQYEDIFYPYIRMNLRAQQCQILKTLFVPGPGLFFQKSLWAEVGGFDERYPFCEEYPFTYNVLALGNRIYYMDQELYEYQVRRGSLCRASGLRVGDTRNFYDNYRFFVEFRRKEQIKKGLFFLSQYQTICFYIQALQHQDEPKTRIVLARALLYFSPYAYWNKLKNFFGLAFLRKK